MFEYLAENPMIAIIFTFIGVLVIGYAKWYERKTAPGSTEVWDDKKFGMFFVVAAAVMVFEYFYTGAMAFPGEETVNSFMMLLNPIFAIFGTAYTTIIAGRLVKNTVVIPTVVSIKEGAATTGTPLPASEVNWLAISVTPTYQAGKGFTPVKFNIYGTQPDPDHPGIASIDVDFGDGAPGQTIKMVQDHATVDHIYTFTKTPEYTGKTFYPIFKCNGSDGSTYLFNAGDRKSVEIWVESL